jgi:asparagine synthase (glutamine-hydrolysing)
MKVLDQKHLLKQAAAGLIPETIRTRSKQPYRAPDGKCFFGPHAEYMEDTLSSASLETSGIFNPQKVRALSAKFKSGRMTGTKDNMALVGILSTEILSQQFVRQRDTSWQPAVVTALPAGGPVSSMTNL